MSSAPSKSTGQWVPQDQFLEFRLGPLKLGKVRLHASVLTTPFIELPEQADETTVTAADLRDCKLGIIPAHPAVGGAKTLAFKNGLMRYVSFREMRYLIDLRGSFADYIANFTAKQRHNILRRVKKLTELSGGSLDCRQYRTGPEMLEFQAIAVEISEKTYKKEIGWTFQSSAAFGQSLVNDAAQNAVWGWVLYCKGVPAAYAFCRLQGSIVYYSHIGYDPQFSEYAPGIVLLYALLERLYEERRFTYLDFLGGAYWQYKQVLSTVQLPSVTLLFAKPRPFVLAVVLVHLAVRQLERLSSRVKRLFKPSNQ